MRETGKLDYIEMPAPNSSLDSVKAFYANAFSWTFTDYGPSYSAFSEGVDGGFDGSPSGGVQKPLLVLYSSELEETMQRVTDAGGLIVRPIFSFPGGRRFHFTDPAGNELAVWSDR
ncbi:VOC family protein [Chelativorans sp. Marseille-P2723]|uniref:VOC family protein n=1 Tax=Chelativorans sp. Marseille-P2723 TaxID=2709133 RepID=UPI00156FE62E|nr:VOC family protein [Chelativorans sp. Marseille-P2723]